MGNHQPWHPRLCQKRLQLAHGLDVEMVSRLIHKQQLRVFQQRSGNQQEVLLAAAQTVHRCGQLGDREAELLQDGFGLIALAPVVLFTEPDQCSIEQRQWAQRVWDKLLDERDAELPHSADFTCIRRLDTG